MGTWFLSGLYRPPVDLEGNARNSWGTAKLLLFAIIAAVGISLYRCLGQYQTREFYASGLMLPKFVDVLTLVKKSFQYFWVLKGDKEDREFWEQVNFLGNCVWHYLDLTIFKS